MNFNDFDLHEILPESNSPNKSYQNIWNVEGSFLKLKMGLETHNTQVGIFLVRGMTVGGNRQRWSKTLTVGSGQVLKESTPGSFHGGDGIKLVEIRRW